MNKNWHLIKVVRELKPLKLTSPLAKNWYIRAFSLLHKFILHDLSQSIQIPQLIAIIMERWMIAFNYQEAIIGQAKLCRKTQCKAISNWYDLEKIVTETSWIPAKSMLLFLKGTWKVLEREQKKRAKRGEPGSVRLLSNNLQKINNLLMQIATY